MEKTEILKDCPFCGSKARLIEREDSPTCKEIHTVYDVGCTNDDCYLSEGAEWELYDKKEIIEMWNDRTKK